MSSKAEDFLPISSPIEAQEHEAAVVHALEALNTPHRIPGSLSDPKSRFTQVVRQLVRADHLTPLRAPGFQQADRQSSSEILRVHQTNPQLSASEALHVEQANDSSLSEGSIIKRLYRVLSTFEDSDNKQEPSKAPKPSERSWAYTVDSHPLDGLSYCGSGLGFQPRSKKGSQEAKESLLPGKMALVARPEAMPPDFKQGTTYAELGYKITSNDQIRGIEKENRFHYHCSSNDRYVEVHKQAMMDCIREDIVSRLVHQHNLEYKSLPTDAGEDEPRVPILVSKNLALCKRVIVFFGEAKEELGTLSGRLINEISVGFGSVVNWIKHAQKEDTRNELGFVIANVGELFWWRAGGKAVSQSKWYSLPRDSAVTPPTQLGSANLIYRNESQEAHVQCVFEDILMAATKQSPTSIYIISVSQTTHPLIRYLQKDWMRWKFYVASIVSCGAFVFDEEDVFFNSEFHSFWTTRCRNYMIKTEEPAQYVSHNNDNFLCPNIGSGPEVTHLESVLPYTYVHVIDYFKKLSREPVYENDLESSTFVSAPNPEENDWGQGDYDNMLSSLKEKSKIEPVAGENVDRIPATQDADGQDIASNTTANTMHDSQYAQHTNTRPLVTMSTIEERTEESGSAPSTHIARNSSSSVVHTPTDQTYTQIRPLSTFAEADNENMGGNKAQQTEVLQSKYGGTRVYRFNNIDDTFGAGDEGTQKDQDQLDTPKARGPEHAQYRTSFDTMSVHSGADEFYAPSMRGHLDNDTNSPSNAHNGAVGSDRFANLELLDPVPDYATGTVTEIADDDDLYAANDVPQPSTRRPTVESTTEASIPSTGSAGSTDTLIFPYSPDAAPAIPLPHRSSSLPVNSPSPSPMRFNTAPSNPMTQTPRRALQPGMDLNMGSGARPVEAANSSGGYTSTNRASQIGLAITSDTVQSPIWSELNDRLDHLEHRIDTSMRTLQLGDHRASIDTFMTSDTMDSETLYGGADGRRESEGSGTGNGSGSRAGEEDMFRGGYLSGNGGGHV